MSVINMRREDPTLANRYLAGQLSDAECTAFEAELAQNPEIVRELEATARLKVGLEKLRETGELAAELQPKPPLRRPLLLALAASVAVLVITFSIFRSDVERLAPPTLASAVSSFADQRVRVTPVAQTFAVFRKRVDAYDAIIVLPATPQAIELRILPETPADSGRYRVSLSRLREDSSLEPAASVSELQPESDGFVTVFADASRLEPGRYRLVVSGERSVNELVAADAFRIRVLPAGSK
jgi:hypothetical protein